MFFFLNPINIGLDSLPDERAVVLPSLSDPEEAE